MQNILNQIDNFYQKGRYEEAYQYMLIQLEEAINQNRDDIVLGLLNELMGYYRVHAQFELGNIMAIQANKIINGIGLSYSIDGATTYLNIATLYRVQSLYKESLQYYQKALQIYQNLLNEDDERYISLYNNISLLYQEIGEVNQAVRYELKALNLIKHKENCEVETAITYTNLSQICFSNKQYNKGLEYLTQAIHLFLKYAPDDPHYFAALSSKAHAYYLKKDYQRACQIYEDVLKKIENVYGQNQDYQTVYENYLYVKKKVKRKSFGLKLSKDYYYEIGKPMLEEQFADYLSYIAVGLVGMGSECLGYDDELSQDHDYGPGFCIWLPKDVYNIIGKKLQNAYNNMPKEYHGFQRQISFRGQYRVGVFEIDSFFSMHLKKIPNSLEDWLYCDENALLMMTSGQIFEDNYGEVTRIQHSLKYFPEDVRIKKIAYALAKIAQSGQYNYARCMKRKDHVAASLSLYEFVEQTFSCLYLLNKQYKPYYKWVYQGTANFSLLEEVPSLLKQLLQLPNQDNHWTVQSSSININDKKIILIEKICRLIINELHHQGLSKEQDNFLEQHVDEVINNIQDITIKSKYVMEA